jgi:hypothetical protein
MLDQHSPDTEPLNHKLYVRFHPALTTPTLPLALSLRRPGCSGDAVVRFLHQPALKHPTNLFSASLLQILISY